MECYVVKRTRKLEGYERAPIERQLKQLEQDKYRLALAIEREKETHKLDLWSLRAQLRSVLGREQTAKNQLAADDALHGKYTERYSAPSISDVVKENQDRINNDLMVETLAATHNKTVFAGNINRADRPAPPEQYEGEEFGVYLDRIIAFNKENGIEN